MKRHTVREWLSVIPYLLIPASVGLLAYSVDIYNNWYKTAPQNRKFENVYEFRKWLSGKEFTSVGDEHVRINSNGDYEKPTGNLILRFNGDKLTIDNCTITYNSFYDMGAYSVSYKECGYGGEYFKLVIPITETPYIQSRVYDTSSLTQDVGDGSSAIRHLDIITSRQEVIGNNMDVTETID